MLRDGALSLRRLHERPDVVLATAGGAFEQDVGGALRRDAAEMTSGQLHDRRPCPEPLQGPEYLLERLAKPRLVERSRVADAEEQHLVERQLRLAGDQEHLTDVSGR